MIELSSSDIPPSPSHLLTGVLFLCGILVLHPSSSSPFIFRSHLPSYLPFPPHPIALCSQMAPDLLQEGSGGSSLSEGVVLKLWLHSKHLVWEDHGRHCFLPFSSLALPISATPTSTPPSRRQAAPAALLSECQHSNRMDRLLLP